MNFTEWRLLKLSSLTRDRCFLMNQEESSPFWSRIIKRVEKWNSRKRAAIFDKSESSSHECARLSQKNRFVYFLFSRTTALLFLFQIWHFFILLLLSSFRIIIFWNLWEMEWNQRGNHFCLLLYLLTVIFWDYLQAKRNCQFYCNINITVVTRISYQFF